MIGVVAFPAEPDVPLDLESAGVFVANRSGSRVPVVQVLTWDTEASGVRSLVAALSTDQPVYVVTPPVAADPFDFPRTVAAWVEHVESRLSAVDLPEDLVYMGWSFGGVVALEVAQQRLDRWGSVAPIEVLLIDSRNPNSKRERLDATSKLHGFTRLAAETLALPQSERRPFLQQRTSNIRDRRRDADEPSDEMSPLRRAIFVSWFKYISRFYDVSGTLLWCDDSRTSLNDAALGWSSWWNGPFRFARLGADHFSAYGPSEISIVATEIERATTRPS